MTMPHLMNCGHSDTGWCLDCVKEMHTELEEHKTFIRAGIDRYLAKIGKTNITPLQKEKAIAQYIQDCNHIITWNTLSEQVAIELDQFYEEYCNSQDLSFNQLATALNNRGKHWNPDGKELPVWFRALELGGETGELLDAIKKMERDNLGIAGGKTDMQHIGEELGDVIISAQLLADSLDINLAEAVKDKFNKTRLKMGFPNRI